MNGKITLEEHFAIEDTLGDSQASQAFQPAIWKELHARLLDMHDKRLAFMDQAGIEKMLVSLNAPAVQALSDPQKAADLSRRANDALIDHVRKRPDRFAALAALPMQDPELATKELKRSIKELGFKGVLVNGFSDGIDGKPIYYDLSRYRAFWAELAALNVPFYLHPRNPLPDCAPNYEGHWWLGGPTWAFAAETAVHALRLIGSGLFDEHPKLTMIVGHLGEGIPAMLWRIDNRLRWMQVPNRYTAKKKVADYIRANFFVTTSGFFHTPALINTINELGADRILFSADYPFDELGDAANWFDNAKISESDRQKIGRANAVNLFNL
jgi:2,3-dihydroxybenzoate decarboxylase